MVYVVERKSIRGEGIVVND